jgi:hypothetical protein
LRFAIAFVAPDACLEVASMKRRISAHWLSLRDRSLSPLVAAFASCLVVLVTELSLAVPIPYGDRTGDHVIYLEVTEDTADGVPLVGPPIVSGNSMDFNPVGFDASAVGAGASGTTVGDLSFTMVAKPGRRLDMLVVNSAGATTLAGSDGSPDTQTQVTAGGMLRISEVDFGSIPPIDVNFSLTFNPSGGTYHLNADGGGGPAFFTQWNGSVTINLEQILLANAITAEGVTRMSIDMNNSLLAGSRVDTSAQIGVLDFAATARTLNRGDYNSNGMVDAPDYTIWRDTLGSTTDLRANGDDTNSLINVKDYTVWRQHFGEGAGSGSAAVPEPAAIVLAIIVFVSVGQFTPLASARYRASLSGPCPMRGMRTDR